MVLDKKDLVAIRPGQASDFNFIMASWLRGLYYGDTFFREVNKDIFMKNYHNVLTKILHHPTVAVQVACMKDDPEVIFGYCVRRLNAPVVDWVFVKSAWRGIGIAKSLFPPGTTTVTHITKSGLSIIKKNPSLDFNPFLI